MAKFSARFLLSIIAQTFLVALSSGNASPIGLTSHERASLRFHLENLYNELDLLRKNQRADLSDLKHQEHTFQELKVFERIPFKENILGLKSELTQSAHESKLKLIHFKVTGRSQHSAEVPKKVFTHSKEFQFSADQLVEKIYFEAIVSGTEDNVQQWIKVWHDNQLRLIELNTEIPKQSVKHLNSHQWKIAAHAFRFRDVRFPTLIPRNPRELLPAWAQKDPTTFAQAEPILWNFVTQIESLIPNSGPYYQVRSQFLLNNARMHFFMAHAR